jgi:hypothetical protein
MAVSATPGVVGRFHIGVPMGSFRSGLIQSAAYRASGRGGLMPTGEMRTFWVPAE